MIYCAYSKNDENKDARIVVQDVYGVPFTLYGPTQL